MSRFPRAAATTVARMVATQLGERFGQQVVIDNRGGAAACSAPTSRRSRRRRLHAAADLRRVRLWPALYKNLPYDRSALSRRSGILGSGAAALTVHPSLPSARCASYRARESECPARSITLGRRRQPAASRLRAVHDPGRDRRGARARTRRRTAMADVIGGQAQIVMPSLIQVCRTSRAAAEGPGHERHPAQRGPARRADHRRSGVPGYEAHNWWPLAPAGTPAPVMEKMHSDLTSVLASRETEKRFETEAPRWCDDAREFGAFISAELVKCPGGAEVCIKAE